MASLVSFRFITEAFVMTTAPRQEGLTGARRSSITTTPSMVCVPRPHQVSFLGPYAELSKCAGDESGIHLFAGVLVKHYLE